MYIAGISTVVGGHFSRVCCRVNYAEKNDCMLTKQHVTDSKSIKFGASYINYYIGPLYGYIIYLYIA